MSAFTKPPNDAGNPGVPKPEGQPAKTSTQPKPSGPPVIVTRTIDVGPAAKPANSAAARPAAPPMGAPSTSPKPPPPTAAQPAVQKAQPAPTLRMDQPPKSVRPAAPAMGEDPNTSIADTFERLLSSDVERGFDAIERKSDPGVVRDGVAQTDLAEVRALFAQLAANHVRPVRDFLIDLRWGEATLEWIDVCAPSLKSLRRAAEKLELIEMCAALDAFSAALGGGQERRLAHHRGLRARRHPRARTRCSRG